MVAHISFWFSSLNLSVYILLLMTIERLIAIRFPFKPLKRRTLISGIFFVFLMSVAVFFYYFYQLVRPTEQIFHFEMELLPEMLGFFINLFLPSAVNIFLYIIIFYLARAQRRRVNSASSTNRSNTKIYQYVMVLFCTTWLPFALYNA